MATFEGVDDRLHSGSRGPGESGYESEAELCIAFCRDLRDLLVKNIDRASGKNARGELKVRSIVVGSAINP